MYHIAVVGCGMMSGTWIEIASHRKDCTIVALIDVNIEMAKEKLEKYKINATIYTTLTEALEKERINLVFDITPPAYHYDTVSTALLAGCDVFGEKPMSDSLESSYKLVELSKKTGKKYFVMQNRRYYGNICAFKNFIQSNEIGDVGQLSANFQLNPHFGGFREEMDSPLIADMAIHTFDAARFILGKNPVSVYCCEFNPSWSWYKGNASAVCIFEMEDGSVFDYRGSWCTNGLNTPWESEWRAACSLGSAFWDGIDTIQYQVADDGVVKTGISKDEVVEKNTIQFIEPLNMPKTSHHGCIAEMFESLINNKKSQTDCTDNIKSIEMVYKAIESARKRAVMKI